MSQPRSKKPLGELARSAELYRAKLSCSIARDICAGKNEPPPPLTRQDWALFHLAHAIEDIAHAMLEKFYPAETIDKNS